MAQEHELVTVNATVVGSILKYLKRKAINYLKFSFFRSVNKVQRGVEFWHSTRNAITISFFLTSRCIPHTTGWQREPSA